jgi:hypothetical protein
LWFHLFSCDDPPSQGLKAIDNTAGICDYRQLSIPNLVGFERLGLNIQQGSMAEPLIQVLLIEAVDMEAKEHTALPQ